MVAPPDTASIIVLCEGSFPGAPWALFQVTFGKATTVQEIAEWVHDPRPPWDAPRERSRHEDEGKGSRSMQGYSKYIPQGTKDELVACCSLQTLKICVVHEMGQCVHGTPQYVQVMPGLAS